MSKIIDHAAKMAMLVTTALILSACAGPWESVPDTLSTPRWSISPPKGWMHLSMPGSQMLSKDGPYLAYIFIQARPLARGFRYTKQKLRSDMLPHEAAQLIADNIRFDPAIRQFQLLDSCPATVGGREGFRLAYCYRDSNDVTIKTIYYGTIFQGHLINLRYTATQRHYFDKEIRAFADVFESLTLIG